MEYFGLKDRVALVTGASSGIGHHISQTLAQAGCIVGIAARRKDRLTNLADTIGQNGGTAIPLEMDVTDKTSVSAGLANLTKTAGTPTILINNAGVAGAHGFLDAPDEETDQVFAVNERAVWDVAQLACRNMVDAGLPGSVINISSITGLRTVAGVASYATSKAAVAHMTKIQALELARYNVRVNALAPGYFTSEMTGDFLASEHGMKLLKRVPMKRHGNLDELDGIVLLLASDRGSFMTGTVIPVDGGHLCASL